MPNVKSSGVKGKQHAGHPAGAPRTTSEKVDEVRRISNLLKQVSEPTQLQIIILLAKKEEHIGDLCEQLGQSQPAVSGHLAQLRHGGFVATRRQVKNNLYHLTETGAELARVVNSLTDTAREGGGVREPAGSTPRAIDPGLLEDVRGFVDDPELWFHTPNVEFEGRKPVELLGTPDERRLRDRLEAAKLGFFS